MTFITEEDRRSEFKRNIVNGPSKFDLMLALFDWNPHRKVEITLDEGIGDNSGSTGGRKHELWITGISAEDGSGESWIIRGTLKFLVRSNDQLRSSPLDSGRTFRAHFRTDIRKGWIGINSEGYGIR